MENGRCWSRCCLAPKRWDPRTTALREVVNAILRCPWRMLPRDFPPRSTVQTTDISGWAEVNRQLLVAAREAEGRAAGPSRYHRQSERNHGKRRYPGLRRRKESQGPQASQPTPAACCRGRHGAEIQDRDGAPAVFAPSPATFPACATSSPTAPMPGPSSRAH